MMTLAFPTDPSAAGFTLYASLRCSAAMSVIPPTDFPHFAPDCAGESAHLTMLTAGDRSWLDGDITWVANGMAMLAGSYAPDVTYTIDITNVPATTTTIGAEVATLSADGRDYITQTIPAPSIVVAPTTTAMLAGAPGGDTLQLTIIDATVTMFTKVTTQRLRESGTTMAFDAAGMLPLFDNLVIATDATAQWSPQQQSADVIKVDGTIANTLWTAILPGSATSLAFPALPSDLAAADPTGQPWGDASVEAIAFPGGLTAADRFALDTQQPPWLVSVSSINYAAQ
jgi:uncharacterized protein (DUF736 family)